MASPKSFLILTVITGILSALLHGVSATNPCLAGTWLEASGDCRPADPGWYVPHAAMTTQYGCPKGTFQPEYGAASCCPCCVGWYADQTTQTHCIKCPNEVNPHNQNQMVQQGLSPAEATDKAQCTYATSPTPMASCDTSSPSTCPSPGGAYASFGVTRRNLGPHKCKRLNQMPCDVMTGRGGTECIDIMNDLESCGGCVGGSSISGLHQKVGTDCSALPGVYDVKCVQGQCVVGSCRPGYVLSAKTGACEARESGPQRAHYIVSHHKKNGNKGRDLQGFYLGRFPPSLVRSVSRSLSSII